MRAAFLYIDTGGGWENYTGHQDAQAALSGLTISWGASKADETPSVNVLHFQLIDRTGRMAGRAMTLLDARVLVQITRTPNWGDLQATAADTDTWEASPYTWATLHEPYEPDPESPPDDHAVTIFQGSLTTGGRVSEHGEAWMLDLYAQSLTVLADRDTTPGPTSMTGRHWTGKPTSLLTEIRQRLTDLGVWDVDDSDATRLITSTPDALAGWDTDDTPTLTDALDMLTSWRPELYRWHEWHDTAGDRLKPIPVAAPSRMVMHEDGHISVETDGMSYDAIPGAKVRLDSTDMKIPDPVTGITLKTLTWDGEDFKDTDTLLAASSLPVQLARHGTTTNRDTRIVTGGQWARGTWTPGAAALETADRYAHAMDMRLRPDGITADSKSISLNDYPSLFAPQPSLWGFIQNRHTPLLSDDRQPSTAGVWLATSGTLTFTRVQGLPVFSNALTVHPMPMPASRATWADLKHLPGTWADQTLTWAEIGLLEFTE